MALGGLEFVAVARVDGFDPRSAIREIQAGECAVENAGRDIISERGLLLGLIRPKLNHFAACLNLSAEATLGNINALEGGGTRLIHAAVEAVLRWRANAKIGTPIIQRIAVNMIDNHSLGRAHDFAVKMNHTIPDAAHDVEVPTLASVQAPARGLKKMRVDCIDCHRSAVDCFGGFHFVS